MRIFLRTLLQGHINSNMHSVILQQEERWEVDPLCTVIFMKIIFYFSLFWPKVNQPKQSEGKIFKAAWLE